MLKIKFIYIFSGKDLLFAQLCDCNFEGDPILWGRWSKLQQIFEKKNDVSKFHAIFFENLHI